MAQIKRAKIEWKLNQGYKTNSFQKVISLN